MNKYYLDLALGDLLALWEGGWFSRSEEVDLAVSP